MEQLIEITTVPIKYQLKVQNASLNYKSSLAEVEITRDQGEMKIRSKPIKLRMDTFDARNSIAPTTKTSITQAAQKGTRVRMKQPRNLPGGTIDAESKDRRRKRSIKQILAERVAQPTGDFQLGFVPTTGPNIQWEAPEFNIEYEMDKRISAPESARAILNSFRAALSCRSSRCRTFVSNTLANRSMYRRVQQNALKASRSMYRPRRSQEKQKS